MRLTLGTHTYDLATRSLVIGHAPDPATARRLVAEGADVIEVTHPGHVTTYGVPVGIVSTQLDAVRVAYQAGAVLGSCPDPAFLALSADAGATVITPDPAGARAAGIPPDRIAMEGRPATPAAPHATLVTTDELGATALAIIEGARVIRTTNARAARRVADVLAAILEAGRP